MDEVENVAYVLLNCFFIQLDMLNPSCPITLNQNISHADSMDSLNKYEY